MALRKIKCQDRFCHYTYAEVDDSQYAFVSQFPWRPKLFRRPDGSVTFEIYTTVAMHGVSIELSLDELLEQQRAGVSMDTITPVEPNDTDPPIVSVDSATMKNLMDGSRYLQHRELFQRFQVGRLSWPPSCRLCDWEDDDWIPENDYGRPEDVEL